MKRDQRLYPLSWTHRDLLAYADRVRMAMTTDHPSYRHSVESLIEKTREFWEGVFHDHRNAEKEVLFACLDLFPDFKIESAIVLKELEEIEGLYPKILEASPGGEEIKPFLVRFAELINHHVRYEERELFPKVQKTLPEAEFNWIGHELNRKLPRLCRTKPEK